MQNGRRAALLQSCSRTCFRRFKTLQISYELARKLRWLLLRNEMGCTGYACVCCVLDNRVEIGVLVLWDCRQTDVCPDNVHVERRR